MAVEFEELQAVWLESGAREKERFTVELVDFRERRELGLADRAVLHDFVIGGLQFLQERALFFLSLREQAELVGFDPSQPAFRVGESG